jgi:hypothetical protein
MQVLLNERFVLVQVGAVNLTDEQRQFWNEWVAALRSGKYRQGASLLRYEHNVNVKAGTADIFHCCLGVAAEMYSEKHPERVRMDKMNMSHRWGFRDLTSETILGTCALATGALPSVIEEDTGIPAVGIECVISEVLRPSEGDSMQNLAGLNDLGVPFAKIADVIELALNGGYPAKEES